mgnify:CR=1 FL=1
MHDADSTIAYDGSFPGFLCACAESLNAQDPAPRVVRASVPESLFEERLAVRRDDGRASSLWERMTRKAGTESMQVVLEAFLSDIDGADAAAAAAMRRVRTEGGAALRDLSDADMLTVEKAAHRSRQEAHLLCGLVRFSELSDGTWYAPLEPSCDALILMADHFAARFGSMRFALHDRRRGSAVLHEPSRGWRLVDGFSLEASAAASGGLYSACEYEVRNLWRLYFRTAAIESRTNPRLQSSRMPAHYWNLLTEMAD